MKAGLWEKGKLVKVLAVINLKAGRSVFSISRNNTKRMATNLAVCSWLVSTVSLKVPAVVASATFTFYWKVTLPNLKAAWSNSSRISSLRIWGWFAARLFGYFTDLGRQWVLLARVVATYETFCKFHSEVLDLWQLWVCACSKMPHQKKSIDYAGIQQKPKNICVKFFGFRSKLVVWAKLIMVVHSTHELVVQYIGWAWNITYWTVLLFLANSRCSCSLAVGRHDVHLTFILPCTDDKVFLLAKNWLSPLQTSCRGFKEEWIMCECLGEWEGGGNVCVCVCVW